jgi:hypothetical protein
MYKTYKKLLLLSLQSCVAIFVTVITNSVAMFYNRLIKM